LPVEKAVGLIRRLLLQLLALLAVLVAEVAEPQVEEQVVRVHLVKATLVREGTTIIRP
jgi:hypothetical protein